MIKKYFNFQFSIFNHKISIRDILMHPLFTGSAIMIFGSNFANFLAYLYHLILGRMLGPASYSELAVTLAAISLFSTAFFFLGTVVTKFVSAAKSPDELKSYYNWFLNKVYILGGGIMLILLIASPLISDFLHIPLKTSFLIGPIIFLFFISSLFKSFLQGLLKFFGSVLLINIDIGLRLFFGVLFVYIGFTSFGGVVGIFLGTLVSVVVGIYLLRNYGKGNKIGDLIDERKILSYSLPIFLVSLANNSFISSDVIMAKHFFNSHDAGIYSSLSVLGRIIFYGTGPVIAVMFPMISRKYSKGENYTKILTLSFLLTLGISLSVLLIYYLFPNIMIKLLFGNKYLEGVSNLFWFGLFMTFYTMANVIISFYLSINRTKIVYLPCIFAVLQVVGIIFMHNSIINLIHVSTLCASLLFISLLIYLIYEAKYGFQRS